MSDIAIIHIVSTDKKIEFEGSVVTNCGKKFLRTKAVGWLMKRVCELCLEEFGKRRTDRTYTVTEDTHSAAEHAPET